jgi:hypothetical protein
MQHGVHRQPVHCGQREGRCRQRAVEAAERTRTRRGGARLPVPGPGPAHALAVRAHARALSVSGNHTDRALPEIPGRADLGQTYTADQVLCLPNTTRFCWAELENSC